MSAFSFPQFTHMLSKIFFTFIRKPIAELHEAVSSDQRTQKYRTRMKDRSCQLNVTKMTGALRHSFTTGLTLKVPINGTHARVHQPPNLRSMSRLIHNLGMFDLGNRVGFLFVRHSLVSNGMQNTKKFEC